MAPPTTFTVAIPTHDRRDTVVLAAQSAVRQTRPPAEVLVLCDGCTDGTADAIAALGDPRIRALELPKGPGYAYAHRDIAAREGTGDVLTYLADDDLLLPDHFEQIGACWDGGGVDLVLTPAVIVHPDDALEWIGCDLRVREHRETFLEHGNTAVMASVSIRRTLVRELGGWDGMLPRAADWDLWRRALRAGARTGWIEAPTVLHFRATGRRQAWPDRVAQNRRWADLLDDPTELTELRPKLAATRSAWEGRLVDEARTLRRDLAIVVEADRAVRGELATCQRDFRARAALADRLERELGDATRLAEEQSARADALAAELDRLAAALQRTAGEVERLQRDRATLEAIYAGGWWRLRARLHASAEAVRGLARRARRGGR